MNKKYNKNFITNFIIRFDYNEIQETMLEKLKKMFEEKYGFIINETQNVQKGKVNIDFKSKDSTVEVEKEVKQYVLLPKDKESKITFSEDVFIYETIKYTSYDDIKNLIQEFIVEINNDTNIDMFNRIGMRYVNNIELPFEDKKEIFEWKDYINNKLICNMDFIDYNDILQLINVQEFKSKKTKNIIFRLQTGIPNPYKPAEIVKKNFIIDIDGYTMNIENITNATSKLQAIHDELGEIFEKCMENSLRNILKGE